jgi:Flp pilus assembly protein TadG
MSGSRAHRGIFLHRVRRQARRGAATVEFAFAAPFLVVVLLGMVDVGQMANVGQAVSGASALGAREVAKTTTKTAAAVESRVTEYLADRFPGVSDSDLASALDVSVLDDSGNVLSDSLLDQIAPGDPVSVHVSFQFDTVRWLGGVGFAQGKVLQTTTFIRRE